MAADRVVTSLAVPMDADLVDLIERGTPFAQTIAPTLVSMGGGEVTIEVEAPPNLHNHVGGPHAATLFGIAETAAAGVVMTVFEDLFRDGAVPLIKSAEIGFTAIARGRVSATARFTGDEAGVRASVAQRGMAVFPVEISVATADGAPCLTMVAQMALKRF